MKGRSGVRKRSIFERTSEMRTRGWKIFFGGAWVLCLLGLVGCSRGETVVTGCQRDSDCGEAKNFKCDQLSHVCLCRSDDACAETETCNEAGFCQATVGCFETSDCPEGFFCAPGSNTCLKIGRCATDLHCPMGQVCDANSFTCKDGCRSHGDCPFSEACRCGGEDCNCDALNEQGRLACQIGVCDPNRCISSDYCNFGEKCLQASDGQSAECVSDYDVNLRPYCDACTTGVAGSLSCGDGPNFCLYSTYTGTTFCGADCSDSLGCPNGFRCNDVIVVWMRKLCTDTSDCKKADNLSSVPCVTSADCPNSALCDEEAGFCYGACIRSEGASQSFCACVEDDDCVQDACDPVTRKCTTTRQSCDPALDNCPKIRCVDFGNKGGCLIGKNCAPEEGLTCEDMSVIK